MPSASAVTSLANDCCGFRPQQDQRAEYLVLYHNRSDDRCSGIEDFGQKGTRVLVLVRAQIS